MKKRILISAIVIVAVIIALNVFVATFGKDILAGKLTEALGQSVKVGSVSYFPPLGLRVKNIDIEQMGSYKDVRLELGFSNLFKNQIRVRSLTLIEPHVVYQRTHDNKIVFGDIERPDPQIQPVGQPERGDAQLGDPSKSGGAGIDITISRFIVEDGKFNYSDFSEGKGLQIVLEDLNIDIRDINFPFKDQNISFDLSALVSQKGLPFAGSRAEGVGWLNMVKKDMHADFKVIEPNGRVGLTAQVDAKNNDMTVKGQFKMGDVGSSQKSKDSASVEDFIFGALNSMGVEITSTFSFKTTMDDFKIGSIAFTGSVGQKGMKVNVESDESLGDTFKAIGKQFENFGKQFYKKNIEPAIHESQDSSVYDEAVYDQATYAE